MTAKLDNVHDNVQPASPTMLSPNNTSNFGLVKGGKSKRSKRSKRSSKRGGACGDPASVNMALVTGAAGTQTAASGMGNMLQLTNGGKKKRGGSLTGMAVPIVLLVSDMYANKIVETFKGMGMNKMRNIANMTRRK